MNKLKSGKTITIKINGKERLFKEEAEKNKQDQPLPPPEAAMRDPDVPADESPDESLLAAENAEAGFDWVLPDHEEEKHESNEQEPPEAPAENSSTASPRADSPKKSSIKSIILSVVLAVLVGTSFGFIMLKLVITNQGTTKPDASAAAGTSTAAGSPLTASILKPWNAYIVQGGVFSTEAAAVKVTDQAINNGIPAGMIGMQGKQYILLGIADSSEDAANLENYYKNNGTVDVYARSLEIPEKKISALTVTDQQFLSVSASLFPILTKATSNAMVSSISIDNAIPSINKLESELSKLNSNQLSGKLKNLKAEMTAAADQVKEYQKMSDKKALVNAQQHLITFLATYYSL